MAKANRRPRRASAPVVQPTYAVARDADRPAWARGIAALALALACSLLACRPPTAPPRTVPAPPPAPVLRPPPPAPAPPPERPQPPDPVVRGPLLVRVGLATDVDRFELPCCDARLSLEMGLGPEGEPVTWPASKPVLVEPGAELVEQVVYRLQVAALKNEQQAQGIAEYLHQQTRQPADAVFDAGTDLYRVRVGRFGSREEAETLRTSLESLGLAQSWVASEGGRIDRPALRVRWGADTRSVEGRWLDITAPEDVGIPFEGGRYRGRLLIYLNDRGRLNVVNELPIEDYLRGVVPKEMGPLLYNRLEALKAQTVAARTYTLRNLGEFSEEGYDICSTPRCQVYGGMAVEHSRSDQAVRETAGEVVLSDGQPAETFYSSTCGGHTENVEVVFPLKQGDYLRGVPCLEAGPTRIAGDGTSRQPFPAGLTQRLLPPAKGTPHRVLSARLEHLAFLANLPTPRDHLLSLARSEVRRYVASVFDLRLDPRILQGPEVLGDLLTDPPAEWTPKEMRFARHVEASKLLVDGPDLGPDQVEALLFELALEVGVLTSERVRFLAVDDDGLEVRRGGERTHHELPKSLGTFRRKGEGLPAGTLELVAGDRLDVYWKADRILGLVQPTEASPVDLSRHARRQRWTKNRSFHQVRNAVQARYPGFPFRDFEVLERGVSGRVGKMKLVGSDGQNLMVEGLAVRWTLDVYDTLFTAEPHETRSDSAPSGWTFRGRGWGHGVGMCQAGAYGMAVRGNTYREILRHYYSGVELGRLQPSPARPRPGDSVAGP